MKPTMLIVATDNWKHTISNPLDVSTTADCHCHEHNCGLSLSVISLISADWELFRTNWHREKKSIRVSPRPFKTDPSGHYRGM